MRVYAVNKACHADETAICFFGIQSNRPGLVVKVVLLEEGGGGGEGGGSSAPATVWGWDARRTSWV